MAATLKEAAKKALVASQKAAMGAVEAMTMGAAVVIMANHFDKHQP